MSDPLLETYNRARLSFVQGNGSWLKTKSGEWYLDLASGIAVNSLGHANAKLVKALEKQASLIWHTSNLYNIPVQEDLARILVKSSFADKVFFTNSGTESIECCIKMARKYFFDKGLKHKNKILTFEGSFHGRSMAAISASGSAKLTGGFSPLLPGFQTVHLEDIKAIESLDLDEFCAILIEPIQGEGGIVTSSTQFLLKLRQICDENNLLFICDEVQSGIGRSGYFFSYEYAEVTPDIAAVAKGIGGGFPLGCCLATKKVALSMSPGTHGSTFGGNPLACAVGVAVLNEILSPGFLHSVRVKGEKLRLELEVLVNKHPNIFKSVRGRGLMLGVECEIGTSQIIQAGYENKLLLVPAAGNVIRVLPPLNITEEEIGIAGKYFQDLAAKVEEKL